MDKFKNLSKKFGWSNREKLEDLVSRLQEHALDYYSMQPDKIKTSYSKLIKKLTQRFDEKHNPSVVRKQLNTKVQKVDEELRDFAEEVMKLAVFAYPESNQVTREQVAMDRLLQGCSSADAARVVLNRNPQYFEQAVNWLETAIENESLVHSKRMKTVYTVEGEAGSTQSEISELKVLLTEKFSELFSRNKSSNCSQLCYNCGQSGHFCNACPKPRLKSQNNRKSFNSNSKQENHSTGSSVTSPTVTCGPMTSFAKDASSSSLNEKGSGM